MTVILSKRSRDSLKGVHPDLVRVVHRAAEISEVDFMVIEGTRTLARQKQMVAQGVSRTLNSRHLTGHAVDIVPLIDVTGDGKQDLWAWPAYHRLAPIIKRAARDVGVPVEWGGDWHSFKDGPHWQLPWAAYPAGDAVPAEAAAERPITEKTETRVAVESIGTGAGGAATGVALGAEPVIDAISRQQGELTSGDWLRVGLAVVIVGLSLWLAIRTLKR